MYCCRSSPCRASAAPLPGCPWDSRPRGPERRPLAPSRSLRAGGEPAAARGTVDAQGGSVFRCFGQLSSGFWLAGRRSGTGRRPLLGEARATRDATTSTAKQVFGGELEMVQEGRDKTQTPSRQGGSTGTQHFEPRACQTMQIESTRDAHGSQSACTEGLSHSAHGCVEHFLGPELDKEMLNLKRDLPGTSETPGWKANQNQDLTQEQTKSTCFRWTDFFPKALGFSSHPGSRGNRLSPPGSVCLWGS